MNYEDLEERIREMKEKVSSKTKKPTFPHRRFIKSYYMIKMSEFQ